MRTTEGNLRCETCLFYDPIDRDEGMCQVNPPLVFIANNPNTGHRAETHFPIVKKERFCGKWRPDAQEQERINDKIRAHMEAERAAASPGEVRQPPSSLDNELRDILGGPSDG